MLDLLNPMSDPYLNVKVDSNGVILHFEGKHLYMSFEHRIKLNGEARVLSLMGHEYHINKDFIDPYLHCSRVIKRFYHLD